MGPGQCAGCASQTESVRLGLGIRREAADGQQDRSLLGRMPAQRKGSLGEDVTKWAAASRAAEGAEEQDAGSPRSALFSKGAGNQSEPGRGAASAGVSWCGARSWESSQEGPSGPRTPQDVGRRGVGERLCPRPLTLEGPQKTW